MRTFLTLLFLSLSSLLSAATLAPVSPPAWLTPSPLGAGAPDVAVSGDVSLAIWSVGTQLVHPSLVATRIGPNGVLDPFPLTIADGLVGAQVVGTNDGFLVVWYEVNGYASISLRFVARDGSMDPPVFLGRACGMPTVASTGDRVAIVTEPCLEPSSLIVDSRGGIVARDLPLGNNAQRSAALTTENRGFTLFVSRYVYEGPPSMLSHDEIDVRRFAGNGVAEPWRTIVPRTGISQMAAAFDGTSDVLVWTSGDGIHSLTLTNDVVNDLGAIVPEPLISEPTLASMAGSVRLAYTAQNYDHVAIATLRGGRPSGDTISLGAGTSIPRLVTTEEGTRVVYVRHDRAPFAGAIETAIVNEAPPATATVLSRAAAAQSELRVATDGRVRAAVWRETTDAAQGRIAVGGLTREGLPLGPFYLSAADRNARSPAIARGTGGYLVAWVEADDYRSGPLQAIRVDDDLRPIDATPITLATNADGGQRPSIAFDGTRWLVVFAAANSALDTSLEGVRVTAQGFVEDPQPFVVAQPETSRSSTRDPDVAWTGRAFAVVYQHRTWFGAHTAVLTYIGGVAVGSDASVGDGHPLTDERGAGGYSSGATSEGGYSQPSITISDGKALIAWGATFREPPKNLSKSLIRGTVLEADALTTKNVEAVAMRRRVLAHPLHIIDIAPWTGSGTNTYAVAATSAGFDVVSQFALYEPILFTRIALDGSVPERKYIVNDPPPATILYDAAIIDGQLWMGIVARTSGAPFGPSNRAFWLAP